MIHSWQQTKWQQLTDAFMQKKLHHTLLFSGMNGIGKFTFAHTLARFIVCAKKQKAFCGAPSFCHDCNLVNQNLHPSVLQVMAESGHPIKIDQIRDVINFTANTALKSQYQCIIIHKAEDLNEFAVNALLKTLEDVAPHVFFLLISDEKSALPKTLLSRVMQVNLPVPAYEHAFNFLKERFQNPPEELKLALKIARGAPFKASALLQSNYFETRKIVYHELLTIFESSGFYLQAAANLQTMDCRLVNELLLSWFFDAAKIKANVNTAYLTNTDNVHSLEKFVRNKTLSEINGILMRLNQIYYQLKKGIHLNKTLTLEFLFMTVAEG